MSQTVFDKILHNVLILEPQSRQAGCLLEVLAGRGVRGTVAGDIQQVRRILEQYQWRAVFLSSEFESADGRGNWSEVFYLVKGRFPEVPVVLLGREDCAAAAADAIRRGCVEYLVKPASQRSVNEILDRFVPNHATSVLATVEEDGRPLCPLVGQSAAMRRVVELAERIAPTSIPVLITGASGTGKELIAQLIHNRSRRSKGPFIKVNCAALSETLLESELFGHEKGAFTGALSSHCGRFERADGGTLLLDEITETPAAFQSKLLRVLEQMSFERVGGERMINVNVRLISTTNRPIQDEVCQGRFRADLYYRLAGVCLELPDLCRRREDIAELVWLFVNQFALETGRKVTAIDRQTLRLFEQYYWPGNIRQLRNVVRTALVLGSGQTLSVMELGHLVEELCAGPQDAANPSGQSLAEIERWAIKETLGRTDGNQSRAARVLGISDRTLREKIRRYRQEDLTQVACI